MRYECSCSDNTRNMHAMWFFFLSSKTICVHAKSGGERERFFYMHTTTEQTHFGYEKWESISSFTNILYILHLVFPSVCCIEICRRSRRHRLTLSICFYFIVSSLTIALALALSPSILEPSWGLCTGLRSRAYYMPALKRQKTNQNDTEYAASVLYEYTHPLCMYPLKWHIWKDWVLCCTVSVFDDCFFFIIICIFFVCFDVLQSKWIDEAKQTHMHRTNINKQLESWTANERQYKIENTVEVGK